MKKYVSTCEVENESACLQDHDTDATHAQILRENAKSRNLKKDLNNFGKAFLTMLYFISIRPDLLLPISSYELDFFSHLEWRYHLFKNETHLVFGPLSIIIVRVITFFFSMAVLSFLKNVIICSTQYVRSRKSFYISYILF